MNKKSIRDSSVFIKLFVNEAIMKQSALFKDAEPQDENIKHIGYRLYLKFSDRTPAKVTLYHSNTLVKIIELSDKGSQKAFSCGSR